MSDITVTFKNETILTMDASGSKPLLTEGKYCEDDISITYVKPTGGITVEGYEQKTQPTGNVVSTSPTFAVGGLYKENRVITSYKNLVVGNVGYPDDMFRSCSGLISVVMPNFTNQYGNNVFNRCTNLEIVDYGGRRIGNNEFQNCGKLKTIILRSTTYFTWLNAINAFTGTPFANGGTGGTIYVPKQYYDQLGTGSSEDFKAATNWSTVDGYGTITWAQIEGSQYENYYADGTPIT